MKVFIGIQGDGDNEPFFINILKIDYILRTKDEEKTIIKFSSRESINTFLSPKKIMKKINTALGRFGDEEIIKQTSRFELIDMRD